jgi:hypothetical protein
MPRMTDLDNKVAPAQGLPSPTDPPLWTEQEYAKYVRKSITAVRKDRAKGLGPVFNRVVGAIRYHPRAISQFLEANADAPFKGRPRGHKK